MTRRIVTIEFKRSRLLIDSPVSSRGRPAGHAVAPSPLCGRNAAVVCADGHELASGGVHNAAMPERRLECDQHRSETCKSGRCVFGLDSYRRCGLFELSGWNVSGATGTDAEMTFVNDRNAVRGVRFGDLRRGGRGRRGRRLPRCRR